MKIKKRKKKSKRADDLSALTSLYLSSSSDFSQMLEERTPDEVAYDDEVVNAMRRGLGIHEALAAAAGKFPEEALQWTEETLPDILAHYDYLLNHEDIMAKLNALKRGRGPA